MKSKTLCHQVGRLFLKILFRAHSRRLSEQQCTSQATADGAESQGTQCVPGISTLGVKRELCPAVATRPVAGPARLEQRNGSTCPPRNVSIFALCSGTKPVVYMYLAISQHVEVRLRRADRSSYGGASTSPMREETHPPGTPILSRRVQRDRDSLTIQIGASIF